MIFSSKVKICLKRIPRSSQSMTEMSKPLTGQYAPMECLPEQIWGEIVKRLITKEPHNLPMALEGMENLSLTSKKVCLAVNSHHVVGAFICAVFMNCGESVPERLFYKLHISSLMEYIEKKGLKQIFKLAQKVALLLTEITREAKHLFGLKRIMKIEYSPSRWTPMGRQGFLLKYNHILGSIEFIHPFGSILVGYDKESAMLAIAEAMINCCDVCFMDFDFGGYPSPSRLLAARNSIPTCFALVASGQKENRLRQIFKNQYEQISACAIDKKMRKQRLIFSTSLSHGCSVYKIDRAFGQAVVPSRCENHKLRWIISEMLCFICSINRDASQFKHSSENHLQKMIANLLKGAPFPEVLLKKFGELIPLDRDQG